MTNCTQCQPKILLTGGTGLVGRNILEHPSSKKWDIYAPNRKELNLNDSVAVFNSVARYQPEIIIHAAGLVGGIKANITNPISFLDNNIIMGRNILMAARNSDVAKFVNLGSSCMYPKSIEAPLTEDKIMTGQLEPTNEGYALAKLFTMKLCDFIQEENPSFLYKTLIPCNIYGKYDNFDPETSHLVPAIIQKIHHAKINDLKTIDVWGDGTARREFLYAGDVADAIFVAIENLSTVPNLMNIGVGLDYSINEYYEIIAEILNWQGSFVHDLGMPVGMHQKLSAVDLQRKWGWQPKTSLRQGIKKTYKYFLESCS